MTNPDFARSLSLLRQEKGISQRQAAKALGISQALLSHYENGAREPGLMFDADSLYDVSEERDHILKGSVLATLSKKLVLNSAGLLFDLLNRLGNKKAIRAAANYLSTSIYILFRHLYHASPDGSDSFFSISKEYFNGGLPRADIIMSEAEYVEALTSASRDKNTHFPPMSHDEMAEAYPGTYQSLLQIVHACSERLTSEMSSHIEHTS